MLPACAAVIVVVPVPCMNAVEFVMVSTLVFPLVNETVSPLLEVATRGIVPLVLKLVLVLLVGEVNVIVLEPLFTITELVIGDAAR